MSDGNGYPLMTPNEARRALALREVDPDDYLEPVELQVQGAGCLGALFLLGYAAWRLR